MLVGRLEVVGPGRQSHARDEPGDRVQVCTDEPGAEPGGLLAGRPAAHERVEDDGALADLARAVVAVPDVVVARVGVAQRGDAQRAEDAPKPPRPPLVLVVGGPVVVFVVRLRGCEAVHPLDGKVPLDGRRGLEVGCLVDHVPPRTLAGA